MEFRRMFADNDSAGAVDNWPIDRSVAVVDPDLLDEASLVTRAKNGDEDAISALYQRHADAIFRYVLLRVNDFDVAEDLTAEVFLKALQGLPGYQITEAPLLAWLYRIAHSQTIDFWRRRARRKETPLTEDIPAKTPWPEELITGMARWEAVLAGMKRLTDDQRKVITLRFIEERDVKTVAGRLGKTCGAVKSLQYRAVASLARVLLAQEN
jgi:RNA polymerase sigma-70 factor (ECF subfamily)